MKRTDGNGGPPRRGLRKAGLLLAAVLLWSGVAGDLRAGETPSGDEIARKLHERPDGRTAVRTLTMTPVNRRGKVRKRRLRSWRKDDPEGVRRSLLVFESPPNIRDSAFLTWDYPESEREDDQWIYLPALRKVRRIPAAKRGGRFFGTDFSYDDIKTEGRGQIEDYRHRALGSEVVDGRRCYVVEAVPVDERRAAELGYGRVLQWVDPTNWMIRKTRIWDERGRELKTVFYREIRRVDGIWTALRVEAENHRNGHRTVLEFSELRYDVPVDDARFRRESLKRGLRP